MSSLFSSLSSLLRSIFVLGSSAFFSSSARSRFPLLLLSLTFELFVLGSVLLILLLSFVRTGLASKREVMCGSVYYSPAACVYCNNSAERSQHECGEREVIFRLRIAIRSCGGECEC